MRLSIVLLLLCPALARAAGVVGAVRSHYHERGTAGLTIVNVRFEDNVCTQAGDDVGGGALYVQGGISTVAANGTLTFDAAGTCSVPTDARAVAVNVTGVGPAADSVLRLFGAGTATPVAQVLALRAGRTRASAAVAVPGALGRLTVRNDSAQPVHVVLDVSGYFR